jgi:Fe-S cluster assembly ATP-binding protein
MSLVFNNIRISVGGKEIVRGVSLTLERGSVHAIMGPNGSGKSTLANAVMGHPKYTISSGKILLDGEDITAARPDERARKGLFLSPQHPPAVEGVSVGNFLRNACGALAGTEENPIAFHKRLLATMHDLGIDPSFASRHLNVGFSGGEKKRIEILQLAMLNPAYAILDETDSGLDVDALRAAADGINRFRGSDNAILIITHSNRMLAYIRPDAVHMMKDGVIVRSGGSGLAEEIEVQGYENA